MAADGPLGSALVDRGEGAWEPVLVLHSGDRGQSPRGGDDANGPQWDDGAGSGTTVCNTVVNGPPPDRKGGSQGFTVGALPVELHRLRAALDWATVLIQRPIDEATWGHFQTLSEAPSEGASGVVLLPLADSPPLPLDLRRDPQRPSQMVLRGCGVFLRVMRPAASDVSHAGATYPVEVQVQGELLATSTSGGHGLVRSVVAAVGRLLWPSSFGSGGRFTTAPLPASVDEGDLLPGCPAPSRGRVADSPGDLPPGEQGGRFTDDQVLALLDSDTRIGRVDVAVDVAVSGEARDQWITEAIFANGSHVEAVQRFSTRARRKESIEPEAEPEGEVTGPARMLGTASRGRTLYVGRSLIELCVYEKDRAPATRSTTLALETLKSVGWKPDEERVIRWEARVSRAWWRDQRFADGSQTGDTLTLSQWERVMPDITAKLGERIRHTDHIDAASRVKRRESSAWQLEIVKALGDWSDAPGDPSRVVAIRRTQTVDRAQNAILLSAARLSGVGGRSIHDVLAYMGERLSVLSASTTEEDVRLCRKLTSEAGKYAAKYGELVNVAA